MPENFADYFARTEAERTAATASAATVVLQSADDTPDQAAGDIKLANDFGKITGNPVPPRPLVKEYRNVFAQKIEEAKAQTVLSQSPKLADWLRDQDFATIARDDLDNLSWFEGFSRGAKNSLSRSGNRMGQMYDQYMLNQTAGRYQDRQRTFGEILDSSRRVVKTKSGDVKLLPDLTDVLSSVGRWVDAKYADMIGTDDAESARQYAAALQANIDAMRAKPKSGIAQSAEQEMFKNGDSLGQTLQNIGGAMVKNPLGVVSWALETAGESAPQLAAALGVTVATRDPRAGMVAMGAGSYATERYTSVNEFLQDKGIDLKKPEDVGRLLSEPELLKEANDKGVIRGAIIGTIDGITAGLAGVSFAKNPIVEAFAQAAQQAIGGSLGEYAARVATGQKIDWGEILAEGLAEIATMPVDLATAGRSFVKDRQRAMAAEGTATQINEIAAQANASKVRARTPEAFHDFVSKAMEGGSISDMYVPADQFVQYFQGFGFDPFDIADEFEGLTRQDLQSALMSGGDIKIPTATYASKIAGSEHDAFFMENGKFDPLEMSAREAAEFNAKADDALQEAWDQAEAARVEHEMRQRIETQIYDSMVSRLRTAGRSTDVAVNEAALYSSFYQTMAQRAGMTTEEFLAKYPLPEVKGDLPEGMQFRNVDELNRTLAEARNRRDIKETRQSLLEFISEYGGINDPGGELRSRDAEVVKRGKGKKTLRLARKGFIPGMKDMLGNVSGGKKFGADDIAQAAIEAGFMADHPVAQEYRHALLTGAQVPDITQALWESIDAELRGDPQYAADPEAEARAEEDAKLGEIEQYLASLGLSLSDSDEAIRKGIEEDQARQYAQASDKNLIVQHNLTAANLLHADKMRGLAVPSIAISNVDYPLDGFGEITLLGGPDMVDPKKDKAAKVFDADVYSPRYPTVRYKLARKEFDKVWKRLGDVSAELGHVLSGELDNGEVERKGLEAFRDSSAVQLQFLRETGRGITLPKKTARSNYLAMVPELAGKNVDAYELRNNPEVKALVEKAVNLDIQKVLDAEPDLSPDEVRGWYYDREGNINRNVIGQIGEEIEVARRPGVDRYAARQAIRAAVEPHAKEFADWVQEQFSPVLANETVMAETASGDIRYLPHTLDNVVKILTKKLRDGEGFNYGVGSIRSTVANQFKSVAQIQAARGRLIPADAMKALKDEVNDEFTALAGRMGEYAGSMADGFGWLDIFSEHLKEVAERGPRVLSSYYKNLPPEMAAEVTGFLDKLANMPTEYFEAKLQRAVDLSEFKAAVIPSDTPEAARKVLEYARVPVFEYNPNVDGARAAVMRAAATNGNLLFQGAVNTEADAFKAWFGNSKIVDEDGKPLVVYHGTQGDFEAFDGPFAWVTPDRDLAEEYADMGGFNGRPTGKRRVIAGYAKIENVFNTDLGLPSVLTFRDFAVGAMDQAAEAGRLTNEMADATQALISEVEAQNPEAQEKHQFWNGGWSQYTKRLLETLGFDGMEFLEENPAADDEKVRTFAVLSSSQIKSVDNRGTFDANDPRIMYQNHNGPRGSIQFPSAGVGNGDTIIRLFQSADLSTMVHETGHYFLTVLQDMAKLGGDAQRDFSVVQEWWKSNADAVAKDANGRMPDAKVTAADVVAALENGTTGDVMKDAAVDVGMQEQFARGFEQYLMEGKAPSADLRTAFEKFRSWLISVYKRLTGLNVQINDEIRGVMDRLIATDEEIDKAKSDVGGDRDLFASADQLGLTGDQFEALKRMRAQSEEAAKARLLRETMAPIKRAQEEWFKEERAKVAAEVEKEVNAYRYYRAIEWMGNRRWMGEGKPVDLPDMRLSKDILVERYGEGVLSTLPRGKQTVYTVDGGLDPDDAASWFGFDSGDELIRAMEKAPKRKEAIEAETDRIMRERHGDALNDGAIEAQALDAVHNDKRGEWIAAELKAVAEVAGTGKTMTMKEARQTARSTMARMRVRDAVASNRFLAAERKASAEAAQLGAMLARDKVWLDAARRRLESQARKAAGGKVDPDTVSTAIRDFNARFETTTSTFTVPDQQRTSQSGKSFTIPGGERTTTSLGYNDLVEKLIDAKRRQLLNHALYMESMNVVDEVEKAERFVAKLGKKTTREKIAGAGRRENAQIDYLGAIDDILERYDFRRLSARAETRRGSLAAFVAAMTAAGRENELAIPEAVLNDAMRKPYKTVPVEELRGVIDSLKNLEHVALRWNKLIDATKQRDLDEAVSKIEAAFEANVKKRPPGRVATKGEAIRHAGRQFLDIVLNATTLLREIDGFKDQGDTYQNVKAPIDEAMNRLILRKEKAAGDLEALYSVYSKEERRQMAVRKFIPSLGYSLSKWEQIAVALNAGNEGNLQRLTDPRVRGSLKEEQVTEILKSLDERDADFIQSVWDYVGSFKNDIAARERRATGVEPKWVEATPVEVGGKMLKGGYYPLKYDARLSSLARDDETQEIAQSLAAGRFGKAQTRNGHLKARAQSSGRDIELDMSVLHRHVNQVIYDLELSEAVANSWRILQDGRIRSAFREAGKQADFDALETWLKDVAEGELKSADLVGRTARLLKSNFTAAKLAFNLSTAAMQIVGMSQSMVVVGKRDFAVGLKNAFRPGIREEIVAKSAYMSTRESTFNKDIFDFYNDPKTGPIASRWGDIKKEYIGPLSFWLMTKLQWHLADVPTWLAGYNQGLRKFGNDEAKAIAHADDIVKRAQASGLFPDRSAIERGSVSRTARQNDVVRLFTALGSYMFAKFNVAYERSRVAQAAIEEGGISMASARAALSWALDMAFLFTLEAVVGAAIKGRLPGGDDDDDDGWLKFLSKETAFSVMGTVPFVRDLASSLQGFESGGSYGALTKELSAPFKEAFQGEVDKAFVKSVISTTGLVTGAPATQINRAVDAAWRQMEGEDVAPAEYVLGKIGK